MGHFHYILRVAVHALGRCAVRHVVAVVTRVAADLDPCDMDVGELRVFEEAPAEADNRCVAARRLACDAHVVRVLGVVYQYQRGRPAGRQVLVAASSLLVPTSSQVAYMLHHAAACSREYPIRLRRICFDERSCRSKTFD